MVRYNGRTDENQAVIVEAFRNMGASVYVLSSVGMGCPDLIVGYRGLNHLVEVKNPKNAYGRKGLNRRQQKWAEDWRGGPVHVVRTVVEAVTLIRQQG